MDARELKQYEHWKERSWLLQRENDGLRAELGACTPALYHASQQVGDLRRRVDELTAENVLLRQRLEDLTEKLQGQAPPQPAEPPPFVKANTPPGPRKKRGRPAGHPAALRPMPRVIHGHRRVPLPHNPDGHACCPQCRSALSDLREHERVVEDVVPAKVRVTCYHTHSGYCPHCRRRVESRGRLQPPAADVPQAQLGVNALALAALLRVNYRLPYRQVSQLFADVAGLRVSPAGVCRQVGRLGGAMRGEYLHLRRLVRSSPVVNMDETSWRVGGKNGWLWAMLCPKATVYHADRSRGKKVVRKLLGRAYGGTLTTDFYSAYGEATCAKQKCIPHLQRELKRTAAKVPEFAAGRFYPRCGRLMKDLLGHKKQMGRMAKAAYHRRGRALERRLATLAAGPWRQADERRLAKRLRRHGKELTRFLWHAEVEGTNNAAERALRPVVVARKVSGGSRSAGGAKALAVLASVLRTARQQGRDLLRTMKSLLQINWAGKKPGLLVDTS